VSITDTAELYIVKRMPEPVADEAEADTAAELIAEVIEHSNSVQELMVDRGDAEIRTRLRAELRRLVAAAQALDGHLAEADRADADAATAVEFDHWLNSSGGER
jgi:hypothetical protein